MLEKRTKVIETFDPKTGALIGKRVETETIERDDDIENLYGGAKTSLTPADIVPVLGPSPAPEPVVRSPHETTPQERWLGET